MDRPRFGTVVISLALVAACNTEGEGRESSLSGVSVGSLVTVVPPGAASEGTTAGPAGTTGTTDASTSAVAPTGGGSEVGGGTDAAGTGGEAPKLDLGGGAPGVPVPPKADGCERVDLLFVIDDSSSGAEEQARLIAGFPGLVEELGKSLGGPGMHIGVVTSDAYEFNATPCDGILGALVTRTGGADSSDRLCTAFGGGRRYLTESDDLTQGFACAALVGTDGSADERPIDAALHAVGPGLAAAGECNEGFVRDDALLVLVVITDADDTSSDGEPSQWFHDLVGLRGGIESNIVVLTLAGTEQPMCGEEAEIGHRLIEFTGMFTHGSVGRICAADFAPFFEASIPDVVEACANFSRPK